MALPTRPLAILDACGTTRSIAREVDGNATGPKTLETLGDTAFGAGAHAMSDFEGYSAGSDVTVFCYTNIGSTLSCCDCRYACLVYNPALGGTQTYCGCICWYTTVTTGTASDRACQCFRIICNGLAGATCYITRQFSAGSTLCNGKVVFGPIDSNDTVCLVSLSTAFYGGGYGYARGNVCIYATFGCVNGSVTKSSPCGNETIAIASF